MKFESGVHRVQRVPKTEKSGRVHTSTITVAVLAKATESELIIRPDEIEISFSRAGGPGGQPGRGDDRQVRRPGRRDAAGR